MPRLLDTLQQILTTTERIARLKGAPPQPLALGPG